MEEIVDEYGDPALVERVGPLVYLTIRDDEDGQELMLAFSLKQSKRLRKALKRAEREYRGD